MKKISVILLTLATAVAVSCSKDSAGEFIPVFNPLDVTPTDIVVALNSTNHTSELQPRNWTLCEESEYPTWHPCLAQCLEYPYFGKFDYMLRVSGFAMKPLGKGVWELLIVVDPIRIGIFKCEFTASTMIVTANPGEEIYLNTWVPGEYPYKK